MDQLKCYRIAFYRQAVNKSGFSTQSLLMTIEIERAASEQYAIESAKRQFERSKHVMNWSYLATDLDVQEVRSGGPPEPKTC